MNLFLILSFNIVYMLQVVAATLANGLSKLKSSVACLIIGAIINILMSIVLTRIYPYWISVVVANVLAMLPYATIVLIDMMKQVKQMEIEYFVLKKANEDAN